MEAKSVAKVVRISSQKAGLVARLLKYKSVEEAISILQLTPLKSGDLFLKVLNSAIANAVENHGMLAENLVVKTATATEGPTMKRYKARAKGRADQISKRTSHLTIIVSDDEKFRKEAK